ncbi:1504_t:CDS:2, partial [Racocetra fulgida]
VTCTPKQLQEFIHFGIECTEYNSVTGTSNVNMQMTVLYHMESVRFQKYLGHLGSNIKLGSTYLISGLFKFSTSEKMMVKATDIDYLRTSNIIHNTYENFSSNPSTQSIIDIIADDIESTTTHALKTVEPTITSANHNVMVTPGPSKNLKEEQLSYKDDEKTEELDEDEISQDKSEEESQSKKRKRNVRITTKEKKKKSEK